MAWQPEVGSGTARATDYRDFVTKLVALATSQHVATVVINNGGTGGTYVVGDIVTLSHASGYLDARFEVTGVSAGQITTLRIIASGAFAQRAASATVSANGTGYAVNDIIEVQGGTNRERAKFKVATLSGSGVATVTLFETGGAYSATPSNPAATVGVGPNGFGGDDACTLTVTYQAIIGTTGLAVTGGGGTGATVDITLAQSGWTVDGRNKNDYSHNSITDEKQVTLVGDASGFTNKPYVHFITGTETSGLDTRYYVQCTASIAHNSSLEIHAQPGISPGFSGGSFADSGSYLLFPQNQSNDADFWMSVDDQRLLAVINENPSASTDNGRYMQMYVGYMDRLKTETEDPYPMFLFASSRDRDANPTTGSDHITSIAELRAPSSGPGWFYRTEGTVWTQCKNNDTGGAGSRTDMMFPFGEVPLQNDTADAEYVVVDGPIQLNDSIIKRDRTTSSRSLLLVPGTSAEYLLYPLTVIRKLAADVDETTDSVRGSLRDVFWIYNDDNAGSRILHFSEDYITIGSDRYRIFHNHVHFADKYQYLAVKEDV